MGKHSGKPSRVAQNHIRKGRERERPIAKSPQLKIDVPALFFGAIIIVFVLWPAAQWALGLYRASAAASAP